MIWVHQTKVEQIVAEPQEEQLIASTMDARFITSAESTLESAATQYAPQFSLGESFASLPANVSSLIEQRLQTRTYHDREHLMRQGDPADGLFLISAGRVEIQTVDTGGTTHSIASLQAGTVVGEMALLTAEPRTASVVAAGEVSAKFLPADVFHNLASEYPVLSRVLTKLLAERLGMSSRDVLAGKTLNDYRILSRLGKGGMAVVYKAMHQATGELVALKMMSHRLVYDATALEHFQREASIIESFDDPGIVRMKGRFQAFRSYFMVLEYCEGVSLDLMLKKSGPLPVPEFKRVIAQLARALAYAHERGIVHRDIKPSNVMLTDRGEVKLMDFGVANPVDSEDVSGRVTGTPQYMAPEQLHGERVDTKADLFGLGCTAWKLLTGRDLLPDENIARLLKRHQNWIVPDVDCTDLDVCKLIDSCLQSDPADRHVDLQAVSRWG